MLTSVDVLQEDITQKRRSLLAEVGDTEEAAVVLLANDESGRRNGVGAAANDEVERDFSVARDCQTCVRQVQKNRPRQRTDDLVVLGHLSPRLSGLQHLGERVERGLAETEESRASVNDALQIGEESLATKLDRVDVDGEERLWNGQVRTRST